MPARPLSDDSLQLIAALRTALQARSDVEERRMFGIDCFFVAGKLCLGVKHGELLVRLPPAQHAALLETPNTRELSPGGGMQGYFWIEPNGFASAAQWRHWIEEALAYNPQAKASPKRKARKPATPTTKAIADGPADRASPPRRHSIFESDGDGDESDAGANVKPPDRTTAKKAPARKRGTP